jgi:hypothetical protein
MVTDISASEAATSPSQTPFPQRRKFLDGLEEMGLCRFEDVGRSNLWSGHLRDRFFDVAPLKHHGDSLREQRRPVPQMIRVGRRDPLIQIPQKRQSSILVVRRVATDKSLDLPQHVQLCGREYRIRVPKRIVGVREEMNLQKVTVAICRELAGSLRARQAARREPMRAATAAFEDFTRITLAPDREKKTNNTHIRPQHTDAGAQETKFGRDFLSYEVGFRDVALGVVRLQILSFVGAETDRRSDVGTARWCIGYQDRSDARAHPGRIDLFSR